MCVSIKIIVVVLVPTRVRSDATPLTHEDAGVAYRALELPSCFSCPCADADTVLLLVPSLPLPPRACPLECRSLGRRGRRHCFPCPCSALVLLVPSRRCGCWCCSRSLTPLSSAPAMQPATLRAMRLPEHLPPCQQHRSCIREVCQCRFLHTCEAVGAALHAGINASAAPCARVALCSLTPSLRSLCLHASIRSGSSRFL